MSDTQDHPSSAQGVDKKAAEGCPVAHDSVTAQGSESENPAIDSPTPKTGGRPHTLKDWWPDSLDLSVLRAHSSKVNPLGPDFSYAREFEKLAGRLRPLRRPLHPDELARFRDLPHLRRPRRRR